MTITIGMPRALLYYEYGRLWTEFYRHIGAQVYVSPVTNKQILDRGVELMVDEACLPLKLFAGHADYLRNKVDYLFVPRIVRVERKGYTCPKIIGLPDLVRQLFPDIRLIDITVDSARGPIHRWSNLCRAAAPITRNMVRIVHAYRLAIMQQRQGYHEYRYQCTQAANSRQLTLAVVGHPYNLYDEYTGGSIIDVLKQRGVRILTPDFLKRKVWEEEAARLSKPLFWTFCRKIVGAAFYFLHSRQVDGVINLMSFGCGPDAFCGELIRLPRGLDNGVPVLQLSLDEHSGDAGMITRLEAFLDMIAWRKQHEGHISASWDTTNCHSGIT